MTDVTPEQDGADESWEQAAPAAPAMEMYPERSDNPHNHRYTLSLAPDKAPFLVVRAQDRAELRAILDDLAAENVYGLIGEAAALMKASAAIGAGLGPATVMQAPQAPAQAFQAPPAQFQQSPGAPPFGPNVSAPQAPGFQGPPQGGFQPQQQGGWGGGQQQGQRKEYPAPQGWYRLNGARKEQVDAIAAQYGIPKGNPSKGGKYNFFGLPQKSWYVAPEVAQAFAQFGPVPA